MDSFRVTLHLAGATGERFKLMVRSDRGRAEQQGDRAAPSSGHQHGEGPCPHRTNEHGPPTQVNWCTCLTGA